MAPPAEKPMFAETNLGTHLAVAVPTDITVGDLKLKLEREHSTCFPSLGEIKVHALMVKRKLQHYHLPDSMPIWNAFNGLGMAWFIFMDISLVEGMETKSTARPHTIQNFKRKECLDEEEPFELAPDALPDLDKKKFMGSCIDTLPKYTGEGCCGTSSDTYVDHNAFKQGSDKCRCSKALLKAGVLFNKRRQRRLIENSCLEDTYNQTIEGDEMRNNISIKATPCGSLSGKISITGIISRYFSDSDEVDSYRVNSAECEKVNDIEKLEDSCSKISRSASHKVASFDIGGSYLQKFENSLKSEKKEDITKCKMVISKVQSMCLGNGRENSLVHVPVDDCRTCKSDHVKLLKDKQTGYMNVAGHVTQSLTDPIPGNLLSSFDLHVKTSRKLDNNGVGNRLLIAATKLGLASGKKRSPISMLVAERGKTLIANSSSLVRSSMFDINDGDDIANKMAFF